MIIDPARNRLYVDAPDENSILVIDLARRAVVENWHLKLARRNQAVALDAEHDRLFVGCNEGDVRGALVIVDTASGREIERLPLGSWWTRCSMTASAAASTSTGIGGIYSSSDAPTAAGASSSPPTARSWHARRFSNPPWTGCS